MLGKSLTSTNQRQCLSTHGEVEGLVQSLQIPGVSKSNGLNARSSRRHVLVEVAVATPTAHRLPIFTLLDLCGDETSQTRTGELQAESKIISQDLVSLRTLVIQETLQLTPQCRQGIIGRDCQLTRSFTRCLPYFPKVHLVFFCDGPGERESVAGMCGDWNPVGAKV